MNIRALVAFPFLWVFCSTVVFGYQMKPIVVVSTPIVEGIEVDRYSTEKTVVSEFQIEDLNAQDLANALRRTPGVNISRYNMIGSFGGATGGAVFIRGLGSSRPGAEIKTFIDGAPMYMSIWNHPLLDLLSIDPAQSIEVYKSPQPHVFGNALGVINIAPRIKREEGFQTKISFMGGAHETYVAKGDHGGKVGNFDYYVGGGYRISKGHRENADGELQDFYGRIGYQISQNWKFSLFALRTDNWADDPGVEGNPQTRLGRYETKAWLTTVTLENKYDVAEGALKFYTSQGNGNWLDQPTGSDPKVKEDLYNNFLFRGVKAREVLKPWNGGEVIVGVDLDYVDGDYNKIFSDGRVDIWEGHDYTILSPYVAISHMIGSKESFYVIPSLGMRYYSHSDFDSELAPHGGVVFGYKDFTLHLGYSKGIVYPGLEVVVLSEKVTPALGKSWESLGPEKMDHFEVGFNGGFFDKLVETSITWFYNDGKDHYVIVPPPPFPPRFENIENYRTKGVEVSANINPTEDLSAFAGVTFLDTEPEDLPYSPDITFTAGMNWRFLERFKLSLDMQYVDKMYVEAQARRKDAVNTKIVDSYFILNGRVSYKFSMGEIFVAVENLTNEDYEYLPGYPMPGITWMVGGKFEF